MIQKEKGKKEIYLILHNIRSVHNVGSIFRTADGAGVAKIYLAGVTPAPIDRFGRIRKDLIKVALGAEQTVPWEQVVSTEAAILNLKSAGVEIIALEQSPKAVDYKEIKPKYPCALILGEEVNGIAKEILDQCDTICEIPMKGEKESLNVSVSAGIALFRILNI
jgi:23S rRNA (guanosine2251-2'-O)-methyltransferase